MTTKASYDICSKNWHLQPYRLNGSFANLVKNVYSIIQVNGTQVDEDGNTVTNGNSDAVETINAFPFSLPLSGRVSSSTKAQLQGVYGLFWTNEASSNSVRAVEYYIAAVDYSSMETVNTVGGDPKEFLLPIRCVATVP